MHVLLIGPPWAEIYGRFRHAAKVGVFYPPLGLCYLAAALEAAGHTARVVDAEAEELDLAGIIALAQREKPDLVGIQVVSPLWDVVLQTCRALKNAIDAPIVLGGPHVTITGLEALEQNAHAALQVAHRAYVLETGRIVLEGPAADVRRDPQVKEAYLG